LFLVVRASAVDCLERLVSELTYYVLSGTLISTHLPVLTHSVHPSMHKFVDMMFYKCLGSFTKFTVMLHLWTNMNCLDLRSKVHRSRSRQMKCGPEGFSSSVFIFACAVIENLPAVPWRMAASGSQDAPCGEPEDEAGKAAEHWKWRHCG